MITFSECLKKKLYFLEIELRFFFLGGGVLLQNLQILLEINYQKWKDPVQGNENIIGRLEKYTWKVKYQ